MKRTPEEKMFRILITLGADILEAAEGLRAYQALDDEDADELQARPTFNADTLRLAINEHKIDELDALIDLDDTSEAPAQGIDPLTTTAREYLNALWAISHRLRTTTEAAAQAVHTIYPLFIGVSDNEKLDQRMRFLLTHHRGFRKLSLKGGVYDFYDRRGGRPEVDFRTIADAAATIRDGTTPLSETQIIEFCATLAAKITPGNHDYNKIDPRIARATGMKESLRQ